jgi:hypothetical protein
MDYSHLIAIEPGKRSGQPCIRGMRIIVRDVLEYLAGGMVRGRPRLRSVDSEVVDPGDGAPKAFLVAGAHVLVPGGGRVGTPNGLACPVLPGAENRAGHHGGSPGTREICLPPRNHPSAPGEPNSNPPGRPAVRPGRVGPSARGRSVGSRP